MIKNILRTFSCSLITSFILISFQACSGKEEQVFNKSAIFWYNEMIKSIDLYNLDKADDFYTSLNSEHKSSPLISTSLIILANAHVEEEEYELANYYLDEYLKRFAMSKNVDYVRFFKIKSKFLAFNAEFRNQKLVNEILLEINEYISKFPNSKYLPLVYTMSTRLEYAQVVFNQEISDLYKRIDKPKASKFYEEKVKVSNININDIKKVTTPWYKRIFQ
ncbi:MAG: outer membrane protein assembly factor BamD [Campylobacterales bacterium]|nr:outer membrane protein assembly factor BamD [Campylobacterales bacterium]